MRGYAMAIVLLVSVLLSLALSSMFFALSAATKITAKNLGTRRSQYICDGVVALAANELRKATQPPVFNQRPGFSAPRFGPTPTLEQLNAVLEPLRVGVRRDGVVIDQLEVELGGGERLATAPSGGFAGLEVSVVDMDLKVGMAAPDAPPCTARQVLPLASVSLFQFPAFSTGDLSIFEPDRSSWRFPNRLAYVWAKGAATVDARILEVQARDAQLVSLSLPSPPTGLPPPAPTDLKFWIQPPNTGFLPDAPAEPRGSRAAFNADIRILDGEWYVRDPDRPNAWPGRRIYSDHPCTDDRDAVACSSIVGAQNLKWKDDGLAVRRLYSRYERNGNGFLDGGVVGGVGAGVVSYGSVVGGNGADAPTPAGFLSPSICAAGASPDGFARFDACVAPRTTDPNGRRGALVDAARGGFRDPTSGPQLPINIDIGQLGAALTTRTNGELGSFLCLPRSADDAGGCTRIFNGIVYVSASRGTGIEDAPASVAPVASDPRVGRKLPWPLCGELATGQNSLDGGERVGFFPTAVMTGCDSADYARIDSVRLLRADNLAPFATTGLTIITDLPLYVEDNYNLAGAGVRTALMAERVTALTGQYRDRFAPQLGVISFPARPSGAPVPTIRMNTSFFAGGPDGDVGKMIRVVEDDVDVNVSGALAIGWISPGVRTPARFNWSYPVELFSGMVTAHPPGAPRGSFVLPGARR